MLEFIGKGGCVRIKKDAADHRNSVGSYNDIGYNS